MATSVYFCHLHFHYVQQQNPNNFGKTILTREFLKLMLYILTIQKITLIGMFYITLYLQACHLTNNMVCGVGGRTRTFCIQNVRYHVRRSKLQPF